MRSKFMRTVLSALTMAAALAGQSAFAADKLVVYTSQPSDQMQSVLDLFKKVQPTIEVELFRSGTTEVLNKLTAEVAAGDPKADVLLIADSVAMADIKRQNMLMPYKEANVSALPKGQYDPDMTFFGTKFITTGIMYNTKSGKPKPSSWNDLLKPEAKGQVVLPSPLYSGAAMIQVATIAEQPSFGWSYWEKLSKNGAVAAQGNGNVNDAVSRGDKAYGIIIEYMAFGQQAKGSPVEFIFPTEGVTVINQPVAILKTAKNVASAKKFVDFQLSKEAQEQSVGQAYFPLIKGVQPPKGYPDPSTLKVIEADPSVLMNKMEETKKKFADLYGG